MAAQATDITATQAVTGELSPGVLAVSAPTFGNFNTTLTGALIVKDVAVTDTYSATDATGAVIDPGYTVTVGATNPSGLAPDHSTPVSLPTGAAMLLTATQAAKADDSVSGTAPVTTLTALSLIGATPTLDTTGEGHAGLGQWVHAADVDPDKSLEVDIPGIAKAGSYSSTVTFTIAAKS